ncbi:MAG: hypothetical protein WC627_02535 [Legionella sp.]
MDKTSSTFRCLSAKSMDPVGMPRGVGFMLKYQQTLLSFGLLFPLIANAHLISITPSAPFPDNAAAFTTYTTSFTVTNISAGAELTVIDKSILPSGVSITANTCGTVLAPGASCLITLALQTGMQGQILSGAVREWASPTVDGVEFPFNVCVSQALPNITLQPVTVNANLPALREPIVGHYNGKWLIVSGSTGDFHDFSHCDFITDIYVYDPQTQALSSVSISSTDLPASVRNQLVSSDPQFLQDGNTMYVIGGYFNADNTTWTTLDTFTAIDVPGMMHAVETAQTNLASYVKTLDGTPQFKVTGGQLGKIGDYFYLTYGQDYEGNYSGLTNTPVQTYTKSIYKFSVDLSTHPITVSIVDTKTNTDPTSGWRRRDYNLAPTMLGDTETLIALGGPFTPGEVALVWTNAIMFDSQLQSYDHVLNQQANQYSSSILPMYSQASKLSYVATFSGLSNLYWENGELVYNIDTNYGNILDLVRSDEHGKGQEYVNVTPIVGASPNIYIGLVANFLPVDNDTYYDGRGILQLDALPQTTPTLIGYFYGGLIAATQEIFGFPNQATNQVYAIYVTPSVPGTVNWQNVTNLNSGN